MKLSEEILLVLQNAAKLNQHLVVPAGNKIQSITDRKNRLMICTLPEEFPIEFALHDLSGFLRQLSLFEEPSIKFKEDKMLITDDHGAKSSYQYSNKEDLVYLDKELNVDGFFVDFNLSSTSLDKIIRACAANSVHDISFVGDGEKVFVKALNKENPTRVFSIELCDCEQKFEFYIKHEKKNKLTIMPLDYKISLSNKGLIKFETVLGDNSDIGIEYYVACERDFKYE